jgi:site-specific DNA-methyltransferase (adenine-specific)
MRENLNRTDFGDRTSGTQPRALPHGNQRIVIGDCLHVLTTLPDRSVDVIVTSPPYNIGVSYRSHQDNQPTAAYLEWLGEVAKALRRVLKDEGSLFLNADGCARLPWRGYEIGRVFSGHFCLQNEITWVKAITIGDQSRGHFKPIRSARYLNRTAEKLFHFTKKGDVAIDRLAVGVPYADKRNIRRWKAARGDLRCGGNTWFLPYKTVRSKAEKFDHPAGYPVELPEVCLRLVGSRGTVLDPFAGCGTTLVAAQRLGMSGLGIEIDEMYAAQALSRLASVG